MKQPKYKIGDRFLWYLPNRKRAVECSVNAIEQRKPNVWAYTLLFDGNELVVSEEEIEARTHSI